MRGQGEFVADVSREGQLHAFILRSPIAHGRIRSWNIESRAENARRACGGTRLRPAAALAHGRYPACSRCPRWCRFTSPCWHRRLCATPASPLAVVLADTAAIAEDAAAAIDVEIEALPAVTGIEASRRGESLLFPQHGSNLAVKYTAILGDAERAFQHAPYCRKEKFRVHRHAAVPMEPRGLLAEWDAKKRKLQGQRRGQSCVFQPPHARRQIGTAGRPGRSDRK